MELRKMIPTGIEDFAEIRTGNYYYVDKTSMIRDLLRALGKVNLFTRPRRFGKSLNMSMLKYFFEIGTDPTLFDGLEISKDTNLCEEYLGQYPVIFVSLKDIEGATYTSARDSAVRIIFNEALRLNFLASSDHLTSEDKELFSSLKDLNMDDGTLKSSLKNLCSLLEKHYSKKVILLIDEYDVPLAKANDKGYYENMIDLIRSMFNQALKTNNSLYFAVMTGCLRVSKESIFTGLNNPNILSITKVQFDEYFGFTDTEVRDLLEYYNFSDKYDTVKEWYDGYLFGNVKVYNPWDILCYVYDLIWDPQAEPQDYWSNTSGNSVIRTLIEKYGNSQTKEEIELLLAGGSVTKEIHEDLTYNRVYSSIDNIWSLLFTTGYLTLQTRPSGKRYTLVIPNREVNNLFADQIIELFKEQAANDVTPRDLLCDAVEAGDATAFEQRFTDYLDDTISLRDTFVHRERKENFYHGILLGLFAYRDGWVSKSNQEAGDGFADIRVRIRRRGIGIVIEMKYAENGKYTAALDEAFDQIEQENYVHELRKEGMRTIYRYGVACYKKSCRIRCVKEEFAAEEE
ncbi:MAG: ATP-binding protein [Lachnospiraceae bacterium]|nr:ATP-binding protein [Lachnospiraceae bacterium]